MTISSIKTSEVSTVTGAQGKRGEESGFSEVLKQQVAKSTSSSDSVEKLDARVISSNKDDYIELGVITKLKPTVSNLLINHPEYGKQCWGIIHSEQNRDKPYTKIHSGTAVYLNPRTLEIVFNQQKERDGAEAHMAMVNNVPEEDDEKTISRKDDFSEKLVKAVQPYMGRPYDDIDCYELVVKGLKGMGIRYSGDGGLKQWLVEMAMDEGRPENAYLSGEGLVAASGASVFFKSIPEVQNPEIQAREVLKEMTPFQKMGYILSFSTPTRGHTGIVSSKDNDWTFINSGRMDHHLGRSDNSKGVGEERLSEEIQNWFDLAAKRRESLQITLGKLDEEKLTAFLDDSSAVSKIV